MPYPALVDATDLASWANRRDAQERLPHLVRRLILTTASGITRLHFRAGDGVALPGWDGIVEVHTGSAFVPEGLSVWEMGTDRSPGSKAQTDYDKRSANPLGIDPAEATFVFVTPRRWRDKEAWATGTIEDGFWREVRVYDADDLEAWLEMSPAVHAWISTLLGRSPEATEDLATYWTNWSEATSPPLSADLVTAGREESTELVLGQLAKPPGVLALRADSRLAWVAEGRLDASIALSNTPWDMAAGVILAREAGAHVVDKDSSPYTFESAATVAAGPQLLDEITDLLRQVDTGLTGTKTADG